LLFPKPCDIEIVPDATPNSVRTMESFMPIVSVVKRANSVLTWDSEIEPEAGSVMPHL
jgi:hypothetical protein